MGSLLRNTVASVAVLAACLVFTFGAAAFGLRRSSLQRIDTVTASQLAADYSEDPHGASQPPLSPAIVAAAANDDRSLRSPGASPTVRAAATPVRVDVTRTPTPPMEPTQLPTGTQTPRPTATSEPTETPVPSPTELPTQEATATPADTETPTRVPKETETPTRTPAPTLTKIVCPLPIDSLPPIRDLCETPTPTPKPAHIAPTN